MRNTIPGRGIPPGGVTLIGDTQLSEIGFGYTRPSMPVDVDAVVVSNTPLSSDYNVLGLDAPEIATHARPGQFVMVKLDAADTPLLRRPFSVFELQRDTREQLTGFSLLNKQVGVVTRQLYELPVGARVRCLGPLGRPFSVATTPERAWMVAGGGGLAPFFTLSWVLRERGVDSSLFYGARSNAELFYLDEFRQLGVALELATDDGSAGDPGLVTVPLQRALARLAPATRLRLYACGPTPMMRAVTELAAVHGRRTEVSLEQVMGCGLGGCYSCVVSVRQAGTGPHFVRSCLDGPVFEGGAIAWDDLTPHDSAS